MSDERETALGEAYRAELQYEHDQGVFNDGLRMGVTVTMVVTISIMAFIAAVWFATSI